MQVLIVESNPDLGKVWKAHIERRGCVVTLATTQNDAITTLREDDIDVIILDLVLDAGSAFAVADFASYRLPDAKVIFVTNTTFFSDGSIFRHIPNACAFVQSQTPPEDLVAMVEHYGERPKGNSQLQ
ncbi:MAG: response regulator [Pseudomonadota bacterium]